MCFVAAVQKRFPHATDVEVVPAIQNWLRHANDKPRRKAKQLVYDALDAPRPAWSTIPENDDAIEQNIMQKRVDAELRKRNEEKRAEADKKSHVGLSGSERASTPVPRIDSCG